jgi:predicted ATP-binding protein involved in virulence
MNDQCFITGINVNRVRHLQNVNITISESKRNHLILTGKNGSGKSSLLLEIRNYLNSIQDNNFFNRLNGWENDINNFGKYMKKSNNEKDKSSFRNAIESNKQQIIRYGGGIDIKFSLETDLHQLYKEGNFILAYFGSDRKIAIIKPNGVEKLEDVPSYGFNTNPSKIFIKYLVNLKTQQAYARNEGNIEEADKIQSWFERFETSLEELFEDNSIRIKYDYKNYNFKIIQKDREPYGLDELSDGYSAIINIITDLILRMDHNRSAFNGAINYDIQGIVLIDELETHLHLSLQKSILPFLTNFFPNIQFVITSHSPFILSSIENAVIYDLEKKLLINDMTIYSYDAIVEGYFQVNSYSEELKNKLLLYRDLALKINLSDDDRAKRAELRNELSHISNDFSNELRLEFEQIELQRKSKNG